MNTIANPKTSLLPVLFLFLAVGALVLLFLSTVTTLPPVTVPDYTAHEVDRHADVISVAVTCFSGNGTISPQMMYNPDTKRSAWMCQMDDSMFVWILDELGNTVTMFKNKSKTFADAIKYLANRGYLP